MCFEDTRYFDFFLELGGGLFVVLDWQQIVRGILCPSKVGDIRIEGILRLRGPGRNTVLEKKNHKKGKNDLEFDRVFDILTSSFSKVVVLFLPLSLHGVSLPQLALLSDVV
jgi:hypothetical protein